MLINITPIKVKIYDTVNANTLDVKVNQDDGTKCTFVYTLSYVAPTTKVESNVPRPSVPFPVTLGNDRFNISGADYAAYTAATSHLQFAIDYVCKKLSLTAATA